VKFGNISQPGKSRFISSENLFKESKRSGYVGTILADICRALVWKLSRTRSFIRTVSATLARGKLGI